MAEEKVAEKLHRVAIHLLRRVRREDREAGLSAAKLSALSVLVFGGPSRLGKLAEAEQVRAPTMSRLVQTLEKDGLVSRRHARNDRRAAEIRATARGRRLLRQGKLRRVRRLAADLESLSAARLRTLERAADILEEVFAGK